MSQRPQISFSKIATPSKGAVLVLAADGMEMGEAARACDPEGVLERAAKVNEFKGALAAKLDVVAPAGTAYDRLVAVGAGKPGELKEESWLRIGGAAFAASGKGATVSLVLDLPGTEASAEDAANVGLGILLRSYAFEKYKTKKTNGEDGKKAKPGRFTILCADPAGAKRAFEDLEGVGEGVLLARELVNEPANILGPVEFAERAAELESLGVKVEILGEKEMKKLGMGALLGVAQGSAKPPRLVIMQWNGGKAKEKPVAFIGKGVVFDSGGISIKPAASMEDMKGDMAGAAAVTGLMHALAARKAKANVIGMIGLVENMVDGTAQRPGDIVTSMSGQTIEVINTDAEGRLVLADALWYCNDRFQPKFMIDLATLTGAVLVALGNVHAGLFSNDDDLSEKLLAAGLSTGERLWRLPLGPEYDKLIDSKNADMKNTGGRHAGSITAAQFLKRFVKDTPWAHLDIAGTGMASPSSEINQSWASGFGVRLLDRLVAENYEK
jgi:leucyl aminopeptidase